MGHLEQVLALLDLLGAEEERGEDEGEHRAIREALAERLNELRALLGLRAREKERKRT